MMGEPIGQADLGISTWNGDEWKIGGGTTWGWYTYDPDLDLIYYGTGNPGTWNPAQRALNGERVDNKWSMTIFARDPDTGMAKWVYQKTPFDEWDYRRRQREHPRRHRDQWRDAQGSGELRPQRLRLYAGP